MDWENLGHCHPEKDEYLPTIDDTVEEHWVRSLEPELSPWSHWITPSCSRRLRMTHHDLGNSMLCRLTIRSSWYPTKSDRIPWRFLRGNVISAAHVPFIKSWPAYGIAAPMSWATTGLVTYDWGGKTCLSREHRCDNKQGNGAVMARSRREDSAAPWEKAGGTPPPPSPQQENQSQ